MLREHLTDQEREALQPVYEWFLKNPDVEINPTNWNECVAGTYYGKPDTLGWVVETFGEHWSTGPLADLFLNFTILSGKDVIKEMEKML